jgi:hypothetical protein
MQCFVWLLLVLSSVHGVGLPREHLTVLSVNIGMSSNASWFVHSVDNIPQWAKDKKSKILTKNAECEIRMFIVSLVKGRSTLSESGHAKIVAPDDINISCVFVTDNSTFMSKRVSVFA